MYSTNCVSFNSVSFNRESAECSGLLQVQSVSEEGATVIEGTCRWCSGQGGRADS